MPVFSLWELDPVSLKVSAMSSSALWGVCGLGMALGSLSARWDCAPDLLIAQWEAPCPGACCPLSGARS